MCVLFFIFVPVITVLGSKTASIFFNSILFDGKVNLVGPLSRLKFPIVFKSTKKNHIEIKEKREFSRKIVFRQNRFWFLV